MFRLYREGGKEQDVIRAGGPYDTPAPEIARLLASSTSPCYSTMQSNDSLGSVFLESGGVP